MADFHADLARRWPPDDAAPQRDVADRLHMLATEPEDVSYAETAILEMAASPRTKRGLR